MRVFGNFYFYRLKRLLPAALALIAALGLLSAGGTHWLWSASPYNVFGFTIAKSPVTVLFFYVMLLSFVLPAAALAPFKSAKAADLLYALPLGRRRMAGASLLASQTVYTALFLFALISQVILCCVNREQDRISLLLPFALAAYLTGTGLSMISALFFSFGNTVFDGAVLIVLWRALPLAIQCLIRFFIYLLSTIFPASVWTRFRPDRYLIHFSDKFSVRFLPGYPLACFAQDTWVEMNVGEPMPPADAVWAPVGLCAFLLCTAAAAVLFFVFFPKQKTERIGEISDSVFAYKTLIPLLGAGLLLSTSSFPVTLLLMLAGYVVYRRGFRLKLPDLICLGCALILAVALMFILEINY